MTFTKRSFRCMVRLHRECPGGWHDGPWEPCACPCHHLRRQPGDTDWADGGARDELMRLKRKGLL